MKKFIDFCHFECWESKKIPVNTIRNGNFKPIFMHFLVTASGAKLRGTGTIKLRFCFKISLLVIKRMLKSPKLLMTCIGRTPQKCIFPSKVHFCRLGTLKNPTFEGIGSERPIKTLFHSTFCADFKF